MPFRTCGPPQNHNLFLDTCQNRVDAKTACLLRFRFFTFLWVLSQSFKNPNYTKTYLLSSNPSPAQNSPHGERHEPRIEEFPSGTYLSTNRLLLITNDNDSRFSNYRFISFNLDKVEHFRI